jgi:hypothetical protein
MRPAAETSADRLAYQIGVLQPLLERCAITETQAAERYFRLEKRYVAPAQRYFTGTKRYFTPARRCGS